MHPKHPARRASAQIQRDSTQMKKLSQYRIATRLKVFFRRIINTCRSPRGKEIFTYLCFVALAFCFWFILSISENRERTIKIPLEITNVPDEAVLLNDVPPYIEARINDRGATILGYNLNSVPPVKINFSQHDNKKDAVIISSNSVIDYLRGQLRPTTTILSYTPDSIRIDYTLDAGKRCPVEPNGTFTPSPHHAIGSNIIVSPDSVTIYGKEGILSKINKIATEPFSAENLDENTLLTVKLQHIAGTRIIPDSVTITIPVEEYTSKTFSVPIVVTNLPHGYSAMTFPSHISLSCIIPTSQYAATTATDFSVVTDYRELVQRSGSQAPIEVINAPDYARSITLAQDSVEYIINETASPTQAYRQNVTSTDSL